jgi:hypothetical protein
MDKNRIEGNNLDDDKLGPVLLNPHHGALLLEMTWNSGPMMGSSIDMMSLGAPTSAEHSQTLIHSPTIQQFSLLSWKTASHENGK